MKVSIHVMVWPEPKCTALMLKEMMEDNEMYGLCHENEHEQPILLNVTVYKNKFEEGLVFGFHPQKTLLQLL